MLGSMKTLSLDLRERILTAYDQKQGTREEIGSRFRVSVGMVKKLLQQRRKTGQIGSRHHRSGRKALIKPQHRQELKAGSDAGADAGEAGGGLHDSGDPLRAGVDGPDI
jgi:transposase